VEIAEASLEGLQRTVTLGLLDTRADVIGYRRPIGGANGEEWGRLLDSWASFGPWLQLLAGAALGVLLERLTQIVERHWRRWMGAGAAPKDWCDLLLSRREWTVEELAGLLSIQRDEAEVCLREFGYREAEEGSDRFEVDPVAVTRGLVGRLLTDRNLPWYQCFPPDQARAIAEAHEELELPSDPSEHEPHSPRDAGPGCREAQ
jgi:hypothetical protein